MKRSIVLLSIFSLFIYSCYPGIVKMSGALLPLPNGEVIMTLSNGTKNTDGFTNEIDKYNLNAPPTPTTGLNKMFTQKSKISIETFQVDSLKLGFQSELNV